MSDVGLWDCDRLVLFVLLHGTRKRLLPHAVRRVFVRQS
jgi:hypothetical protein